MTPDHDAAQPPLTLSPSTLAPSTLSPSLAPPNLASTTLAPTPEADAEASIREHRALRVLAGFAETALPAMLLLYLAANERSADTLPELKQVIDTLSEVPVRLEGQGAEPIHTAVGRLFSVVGALRGRIG